MVLVHVGVKLGVQQVTSVQVFDLTREPGDCGGRGGDSSSLAWVIVFNSNKLFKKESESTTMITWITVWVFFLCSHPFPLVWSEPRRPLSSERWWKRPGLSCEPHTSWRTPGPRCCSSTSCLDDSQCGEVWPQTSADEKHKQTKVNYIHLFKSV